MQLIQRNVKKSHQNVYRSLVRKWQNVAHDYDLEYHSFRANLYYFQPELIQESQIIFNKIKINRLLGEFELQKEILFNQAHYDFHENLDWSSPKIFCTFHYGSFGMIHSFLANNGLSYSLLLNDEYATNQGDFYRRLHNSYRKKHKLSYHFEIINAESQGAGLKLVKNLKAGNHLVAYIDGNTGAGGLGRQDDRLIEVQFFNKKIHVRKGIAHLSHSLNVPVVPIISYRSDYTENGIHMTFLPEINPNKSVSRKDFVEETTQYLYNILESKVMEDASQWECWLSIGHAINKEKIKNLSVPEKRISHLPSELKLNLNRYGLVTIEASYFLFDIKTYQLRELVGSAKTIVVNSTDRIRSCDYPAEILTQFCRSEILIPF